MTIHYEGNYINLHELANGDLNLELTAEGKELLVENSRHGEPYCNSIGHPNYCKIDGCPDHMQVCPLEWTASWVNLFYDLFDDIRCNSDLEFYPECPSAHIGLTSAPIIVSGPEYTEDDTELVGADRIWWFPNYMVEDPLETLLQTGTVIFTEGN